MFNINCAWGYLNLYYLTDIVDWHHNNFRVNRYGDPVNLICQQVSGLFKILHLQPLVKQTLLTKFANYPQLIDLVKGIKDSNKDHSEFWSSLEKIDQVRKTDYKTLCPEWSQLL